MSGHSKKPNFFDTETSVRVKKTLQMMASDSTYMTEPSYSANTTLYPDNQMPFVNKHMEYLRTHPATDPEQYLSNLRLMTRVR